MHTHIQKEGGRDREREREREREFMLAHFRIFLSEQLFPK
jgi:hypothetical protein